jgi:ATP synthase subunit 6
MLIFSPLEQFIVLPFPTFGFFFLSTSNILLVYFLLFLLCLYGILSLFHKTSKSLYLIPSRWQVVAELFFLKTISILKDNLNSNQKKFFFCLLSSTFVLILFLNILGNIPFSYTVTSQLVVTFTISLFCFIGIQIIAIKKKGLQFFSSFFPAGISIFLSFLLVPIEFISFLFKPISLATRLFVNMMAGHTLLKVIAGFSWVILDTFYIFHYFPLVIIIILFFIEVAISFIQAFVFTILICVYINDLYEAHKAHQ